MRQEVIQVKPKRLTLSPHHEVNTVNDVILQLLEAGEDGRSSAW